MLMFSLGVVAGMLLVIGVSLALVAALMHSQHEPPHDHAASHN
jgi:hypothetical protein